ncbi:MAG: hypothetical protein AB9834_06295 [Lentimicrobium sp.]
MFGTRKRNKSPEEVMGSTLFDLTHLEINTIIKDEMTASKANNSPRMLLHSIAGTYDRELIALGEKYAAMLDTDVVDRARQAPSLAEEIHPGRGVAEQAPPDYETLFRGVRGFQGSGYHSFKELSIRAEKAIQLLKDNKNNIGGIPSGEINSDLMMLSRIQSISNDLRNILKISGDVEIETRSPKRDFDDPAVVREFRDMSPDQARKYEPKLDLRQLMVIKKANDIGTERVVMQTIIGMDGDITTRISRSFADQPIQFVNDLHKDAISISVDYWKFLITIVVDLGKSIARFLSKL